jgi:hypothetical protein
MTMTMEPVELEEPIWEDTTLDRCRTLVKAGESAAWELGDLILEILPMGKPNVNTGVAKAIRALATEIGGEPATLTQYRKVAHGWPEGCRHPSATWMAHKAYMGPPQTAEARRQTLESLPRNEHGVVTIAAVRAMTKGNSGPMNRQERIGGLVDGDRKNAKAWITFVEQHLGSKPVPERSRPSLERARLMHVEMLAMIEALLAGHEPTVDALRRAVES